MVSVVAATTPIELVDPLARAHWPTARAAAAMVTSWAKSVLVVVSTATLPPLTWATVKSGPLTEATLPTAAEKAAALEELLAAGDGVAVAAVAVPPQAASTTPATRAAADPPTTRPPRG